jgi:hypothetical protein
VHITWCAEQGACHKAAGGVEGPFRVCSARVNTHVAVATGPTPTALSAGSMRCYTPSALFMPVVHGELLLQLVVLGAMTQAAMTCT